MYTDLAANHQTSAVIENEKNPLENTAIIHQYLYQIKRNICR